MLPTTRNVLLGLCLVVTSAALTAFAQIETTKIVFMSLRTGNHEVFVMNADGTDPRNLTNSPSIDDKPAWSPDGSLISFHSDRGRARETYDLYVMDVDGGNVTRITDGVGSNMDPSWSPEGTQLTFQSNRAGSPDIYVIDASGGAVRPLTFGPASDTTPTWSPDGSQILFVSSRSGGYDIYAVSPNGGAPSAVIEHATFDGFPAWSPDGSQIAFHSYRNGVADIYVGDANGMDPVTNIRQLTWDSSEAMEPAFSPDGSLIAFRTRRHGRSHMQIYTVNLVTLAEEQLTSTATHESAPNWSPFLAPSSYSVAVDVKPGSEDNPINGASKGVTPVAILTTDTFDASQVNSTSVRLGPNATTIAHKSAHYDDGDGDGRIDWLGHFRTRDIGIDSDTSSLTLVGQTLGGIPLSGSDLVTPRGGKGRGAPSLTAAAKRVTTWGSLRRGDAIR